MSRMSLAGKVALVAGGSAPIGEAIALRIAEDGASAVVLCARDLDRGEASRARLEAACPGTRFLFRSADLSHRSQCEALFRGVAAELGGLDIYVHSTSPAAVGGLFLAADEAKFHASLEIGLGSLFHACRSAVPLLKTRGGGAILLLASDAGRVAASGQSLVAMIQSAIMAFTRSLAIELARDGIRVNCVSPSFVRGTPVYDAIAASPARAGAVAKAEKRAGLGLPTPQDIAPLAAFLVGPEASKITGQVISVNGGLTAA